jgi:pimeloyl-ACP methyl ester carboxylesterase
MNPRAFTLAVPEAALEDLRARLALTRFPDQAPDGPWAYGTDLGYMKTVVPYWREQFDWRAQEAGLNAVPQFKVQMPDVDLHYLHVPGQKRFAIEDIATCFASLMTDVLGFGRYGAQGGDYGAFTASRLGYAHPDKLAGIHINLLTIPRDRAPPPNPTEEEQRYFEELAAWLKEETGYQWIQGTKPQTLAYGLTDSPAGLLAWIAEKFRTWTDCDGDPESVISRDHLLANVSLYWFTGAIGSSFWPYYARLHGQWPIPSGCTIGVPTGYAAFPKEIIRPPRSIAQQTYTNIQRWTPMPRGGHFAAMEQPEALASEIRAFFRGLR